MTTLPAPGPIGFDTLLSRSWELFKRNWIVALPPVIASFVSLSVVGALATVLIVSAFTAAATDKIDRLGSVLAGSFVVSFFAVALLVAVLSFWAYTATFGMADAAWERGRASFADGNAAFFRRGGATFVAFVGMVGLSIAALILALPTLGLALLALPLALMYVMPAVVSGGRGGFAAIGESFRLVRRFPGQSIIAILILVAILYGTSFIGAFFVMPVEFAAMPPGGAEPALPRLPPIGLLVGCGIGYVLSLIVTTAYYGYMAIALTGLYRDLAPRADVPPVPVPATLGVPPTV